MTKAVTKRSAPGPRTRGANATAKPSRSRGSKSRGGSAPKAPEAATKPHLVRSPKSRPVTAVPAPASAVRGATEVKSLLVAIASDVHFDLESPAHWGAFRAWHRAVRPAITVLDGDMVDLGMLSHYPQEKGAPIRAVEQIKKMVAEVNPLADEAGEVYFVDGNHDSRWEREVLNRHAIAFDGALGFTFRDQCLAQGMDPRIKWVREQPGTLGVPVGPFMIRHGHKQASRYGGAQHLAANAIAKGMGQSVVMGHHHRAQLFCRSAYGRTAIAIANPCLTREHHYAPDADWQRGFTILELHGPKSEHATPYVVIMQEDGSFSWGGRVYRAVSL